ncbi:MAG: hypothetical protein RL297_1982 [Pseudomonadota bacterium]|jgi:hypothetical protein
MTKWKRLFNALAIAQNDHKIGNHLIIQIHGSVSPVGEHAPPVLGQARFAGAV